MLVYVIHQQRLFSLTLPKNIYGNYSVTDIDENNKERMLINIVEENGRWVAYSNKHVKIWKDKEMVPSIPLENYQYLLLQIKGEEGFLVLYTCPVNDDSRIGVTIPQNMEFTVGSSSDNAISCNNPLIAPNHAKFTYQNNEWFLKDLNTQYGTFVNNQLIKEPTKLFHGDVIFILGLKLIVLNQNLFFNNPMGSVKYNKKLFGEWVPKDSIPVIETNEEEREIKLYEEEDYFVRSPRFMEVIEEKPFKIDPHPSTQEPENTPLLLTVGPMMTMGMSSVVMLMTALNSYQNNDRNLMSVLPTMVMSVSMLAGTLLWPTLNRSYTKKQQKKKLAKIETKYTEYLQKKDRELTEIGTVQKQILLSNNISPSECYKMILGRSKSLWMRELHQKDFLTLRLGIGRVPLKINFNYPEEHFQLDEDHLDERMREILEKHKYIEGVPVVESFTEKNIIAITGKYEFIKHYMDILLLQMITFHSYYDLKIVLLTESAKVEGWNYLKQLPHLFKNDKQMRFFATDFDEAKEVTQYLLSVFNAREESFKKNDSTRSDQYKNFSSYYVIITDDYDGVKDFPFIEKVLNQHGNLGFSLMILHPTLANLPTQCKAFIGINSIDQGGIFESELTKDTQRSFTIESFNQMNLESCSLILSNIPIENKDESYTLPKTFGFLEMFDAGNVEQLNSLEKWKMNDPINSLATPIGLSMNGNLFKLDLHEKEQGPHGLIAGMTGSGKSEFIITYILSMAVNFHPDEVQFVLIDYKGGGLVGAFENNETGVRLPHLAGTITNLDTAEINRALASIESELKRRQTLFNEAREKLNEGTVDIYKYQKYYREGLLDTPLSHLFIISDEFAELKSQQPEFMDQLISTARIGRSLGVHLILATQKPSGVVNDQIWSNSRFRVCLKVQEAGDSNEVIKRPDAASLKDVGRFYLQVGYNEFFAMGQAAYAGVAYIPQDKVYHEVDDKISFINHIGKSIKTIDTPRNDTMQAQGEELSNVVKYLDTLAKKEEIQVRQLWLEKLADVLYVDAIKQKYQFMKKNFELDPVIGVYDNPKLQTQGLLSLDLSHKGNTVIYSMNEKNTIVNTILYSLITTYHTKEINIYVMDFDSQTLKIYKEAPQVGDVIFSNETEKINNLFKMITSEIERRKRLFQNYNGSYEFYCKNSGKTLPGIVFMIYGYENFRENFEDQDTILTKISRDCSKYGVYIILTAVSDRSLRLSMRSNFPQIIPLKLSAPIEYNMLLGKKAPMISDADGRGVALIEEEPYEFQTAMICDADKQNNYIKEVIETLQKQVLERAPGIRILPEHVTWNDILFEPITIQKIPIGLEVETLNVSTYDMTKSLIHLVNASDVDALSKFSKVLIQKLQTAPNMGVVVSDMKNLYNGEIESKDFNAINDMILTAGRVQPLLVFITGVEKWIASVPTEIKGDLVSYFDKINELHNCFFIFVDRLEDIKSFSYEKWFKQFASTDHSIFIGRGLNNSTIHSLVTPLRSLSIPIPPNYGYNIKNSAAIKIKVVEGDMNYGE